MFLRKRCSENMQQIYRRTPKPKCDFNKVAKQIYWNHTSAWVFSCKFRTPSPKNTSGWLHLIMPESYYKRCFDGALNTVVDLRGVFRTCQTSKMKAGNFIKKKLQHRCFPVNIAKFVRTPFPIEHLPWLLL